MTTKLGPGLRKAPGNCRHKLASDDGGKTPGSGATRIQHSRNVAGDSHGGSAIGASSRRDVTAGRDRRSQFETEARVRFVRARRELGLTILQAAEACGCSPDAIEQWIGGKRRVPAWALVALEAMVAKREGRAA